MSTVADQFPLMKRKNRFALTVFCLIVLLSRGAARADDAPSSTDVTKQVQGMVTGNSLTIAANNDLGGDPAPTLTKKLKVEYTINGTADSKAVLEGGTLEIQAPKGAKLAVTKAVYGDLQSEKKVDVTKVVANAVQGDKLTLGVNNETLGGDPAPAAVKKLEVSYMVDGKACKTTASEFDTLTLPLSGDGTGKLVILSAVYGSL